MHDDQIQQAVPRTDSGLGVIRVGHQVVLFVGVFEYIEQLLAISVRIIGVPVLIRAYRARPLAEMRRVDVIVAFAIGGRASVVRYARGA